MPHIQYTKKTSVCQNYFAYKLPVDGILVALFLDLIPFSGVNQKIILYSLYLLSFTKTALFISGRVTLVILGFPKKLKGVTPKLSGTFHVLFGLKTKQLSC